MSGAGRLQALDAVFDLGVLAVVSFQCGDIGIGLVGDETLEAVPVEVGKRELRAGVRALAPKVCRLLEEAEEDLTAFYAFPREHWTKLRSTNPLERVNKEIGRRSDVVGIFPNDASAIRLVGSLLIEQNDEWLVNRRYLSAESMTLILDAAQIEEVMTEENKEVIELNAA